ncbi:uncharacterized protein LY89DRAFT_787675 [Mollisia scopiformis]|uniref:Uncharacterized protein n=1 Tax=Mollisia scopiformis TaxID=149040 RepID=A0A132BC80_MOLSC|nr:uncharacterized protein LY89DRAFT_787675 [Mollisia scopiformis]KUJ09996.1 hypothetical protein LY89DRAFT_787675 [Mollisia scopiformis]
MENWRSIDVQDAKVLIGGQHVNTGLLTIIAEGHLGKVTITGLSDTKMNKQIHGSTGLAAISVTSPDLYSIQDNPTALWVGSKSTWFSVNMAREYSKVFSSEGHSISMFFSVVDYYLEDSSRLDLPLSSQLLEIFALDIASFGTGSTLRENIRLCHKHAAFLEHHMAKEPAQIVKDGKLIEWSKTPFYEWITQDIESKTNALSNGMINLNELKDMMEFASAGNSHRNSPAEGMDGQGDVKMSDPVDEEEEYQEEEVTLPAPKVQTGGRGRVSGTHKGPYISPQLPSSSKIPDTFVEIAVAMSYHYVATNRDGKTIETLSVATVQNAIYRDYSISRPEIATRLMRDHARTIYNALLPEFKKAKIGQDLIALEPATGQIKCAKEVHEKKANEQYLRLKAGDEVLKQRGGNAVRQVREVLEVQEVREVRGGQGSVMSVASDRGSGDGFVVRRDKPGYINGKPIPQRIKRSGMYD